MLTVEQFVLVFSVVLVAHWIGDFVCQTDWQAKNKSKNMVALGRHVASYTLVLGLVMVAFQLVAPLQTVPLALLAVSVPTVLAWALVNGVIHLAVDYVTSRWSSRLWARGDVHNFFVVVGFDQLLHILTLMVTLLWLLSFV